MAIVPLMENPESVPGLEGIRARRFRDPTDFDAMSRICGKSSLADGFEWTKTRDDIEGTYEELSNRDRHEDLVFFESGSEIIGYGESYGERVDPSTMSYWNFVHLLPEWRSQGVREAMFKYNEERLLQRARKSDAKGYFQTWACDEPNEWRDIVLRNGFHRSFSVLELEHPDPGNVPVFPLPPGLEIRPVRPERYRDVWEGMREAYRREPWFMETLYDDDHYRAWQTKSEFEPDLWQVAWDGDRIVGAVQNYIDREANEAFQRRVGHPENIFVASDWRHKGVARALISRSLRLLASLGMTEASLDVDTDNASGALHLYRALGFEQVHAFAFFKKDLPR